MKKIHVLSLIMPAMLSLSSAGCNPLPPPDPNPVLGEMTDVRDGQLYQTVTLGDQTWLAQDLNYETDNSWCYEDDPANCEMYGRLYAWEAALTACPDGWHLARDEEWSTLIKHLDPQADPSNVEESKWAGGMLKATGTINDDTGLWNWPNVGATNSSKFSALPGGARFDDGSYAVMGRHAIYWTSTENNDYKVWFRVLDYGLRSIYRAEEGQWEMTRGTGISVRCIMD